MALKERAGREATDVLSLFHEVENTFAGKRRCSCLLCFASSSFSYRLSLGQLDSQKRTRGRTGP